MKQIKKRPILLFIAFFLLGIMLVACGGGDEETPVPPTEAPTEMPAPTAVPEPTDEPEPTAVPEPTDAPAPDFDLSNELESPEGGYAVMYPAEWVSSDLFGLGVVASNEELLDGPEPGSEGAVAIFISGPLDEFGDESDPTKLLEQVATEAVGQDDFEIVDGPTAVTINGKDGATLTYTATTDTGTPFTGQFLLLMGDEHAVVMLSSTLADEAEANLPIFTAIGETMTLMTPVEAEVGTETAGNVPASNGFILYGDEVTGEVVANESTAWDFLGLAGESIDITVVPDGDLDVVVDVVDESGTSILEAEIDDSFETETIVGIEIPESGTFFIVLRGFADSAGDYTLTVVESGTAVTSTSSGGGTINFGDVVSGAIDESGTPMAWSFSAFDGDYVGVVITPLDELDAVIDILDESGASLLENPRDASFNTENLIIEVPADGMYTIQVSGYDNGDGTFSVGEFEMELGHPLTNLLFASDALEEGDVDEGHAFPVTVLEAGEMIGIIVEPVEGLDVAVQVTKDGELLDIPGFDAERGFDSTIGVENFVFIVPEDGTYVFKVKNSVDDIEGNTGDYDVQLLSSSNAIIQLAAGDSVAAKVNEQGFVEYALNVLAGDAISFEAEPFTEESDLVIELEDLDGNALTDAMDAGLSGETETLSFTFTEDALILIRVREFSASTDAVFVLSVAFE